MFSILKTNRELRLLFISQNLSFMGDWFTFVALAGLIQDATGSKFLVSLLMVAYSLPSFLASPIGGPIVDRHDRRQVLIIVTLLQAVAGCGFLFIGDSRVWIAFVAQGLIAALAAFVSPAIQAAIPNLAHNPDELRHANALFGSSWGVMVAAGAGIGGIFSQIFGRQAAFIADIATFVVAAALIALVTRPMQETLTSANKKRMRPIADMREALHLAKSDHVIMALLMSKMTFAIGSGVVSQLAVFAADSFNSGDAGRGIMLGLRGLGSALGPLLATRFVGNDLSKIVLLCGIAGLGFAGGYLVAAASPIFIVASVFVCIAHLGGGASWTLSTYGLQIRCPDAMRGRVMAGDFALITLMLGISSLLAGVVSDYIGARGTIAVFAILAIGASLIYIFATRGVRASLHRELRS